MLKFAESKGLEHVVSWLSHGRSFKIHDNDKFMSEVAHHFFKASKIRSVHRQLNLWGFKRVPTGEDRDSWFHAHFLRGQPEEMKKIVRTKIKGKQLEEAKRILPVPNFYQLPPQAASLERRPFISDLEAEDMLYDNDAHHAAVMSSRPLSNVLLKPRRVSICSPPLDSIQSNCSIPQGPPLARRGRYSCPDISTSSSSHVSSKVSHLAPMPFGFNGQENSHDDHDSSAMNDDEFSLFIDKMIQDPF
jgi:hypothetical protein